MSLHADYIRLRNKTTDAKESGHTIQLLPEGGSAPGDLITCPSDGGISWQYNFPAEVTNGQYTVYLNGNSLMNDGEEVVIKVQRDVFKPWND